jgi:hypothetical protein
MLLVVLKDWLTDSDWLVDNGGGTKSSSTSPPRKYSQLALPRGEDRFILIMITHSISALDKQ